MKIVTKEVFTLKRFAAFFVQVICLILISFHAGGQTTYYFSSAGDDSHTVSEAQNPATPWQTIDKLNSFFNSISPGDSILFKRGDTFYGSIRVNKSGMSGKPIVISAYGNGPNPVISGFSSISSWTSLGDNIYEATVPNNKGIVNCVVIDGELQPIGRYPKASAANGGYLAYESFSGHGQITDNQLSDAPDWTGGEIVLRKNDWVIDRTKITSHAGNVLNFTPVSTYYGLSNGSGYFIQNHPSTLTQDGDWYYDPSDNKIQVYYSTAPPEVKVSTVDELVTIGPSNNFINISNISFEGANKIAMYGSEFESFSVENCNFNFSGIYAVQLGELSGDIQFNNNTISNSLNNAVLIHSIGQSYCTIRNNLITNTGLIAGMGGSGDGKYNGMVINSENGAVIEYNTITHTGYIPLRFRGNNILIKNNIIDYYLLTKMDGGGIYAYNGGMVQYSNRIVRGNIVSNSIGNYYGTRKSSGSGSGIYMDNNELNVDIIDNTVYNVTGRASHNNSPASITLKRNTFFNIGEIGILDRWVDDGTNTTNKGQDITDMDIQDNIFFTISPAQTAWTYRDRGVNFPTESSIQERISSMGVIDNNYYHLVNDAGFDYRYRNDKSSSYNYSPQLSFYYWKSFTGYEMNSTLIPTLPLYHINEILSENLYDKGQFESNISGVHSSSSPVNHIIEWDNTGKISGMGSLKVSFKTPNSTDDAYVLMYAPIGTINSSKNYILRFSTLGTTEKGVVRASIRKTDSPLSILTSVQSKSFGTSRVDHEFLIKAPASDESASWHIEVLQASGTTYIDNIEVYEVDVTDADIEDQVKFVVNATKSDSTVSLDGKYFSVKNEIYDNSITLQPYSSAVLMKYKGNIQPFIKDQSFLLPDNSTTGTVIGTVLATDPEGQTLTYSILSGNTDGAFNINSLTGEITVANPSAPGPEYNLLVQVQDNGTGNLSNQATITIGIYR